MVYAFDYDSTITDTLLQQFAIKLRKQKNDIWIVTMRSDNEFNNSVMKPVLDKLGLSKYSVVFCGNKPKFEYLQAINADVYIDNITDEFEALKNHTNIVPLLWV